MLSHHFRQKCDMYLLFCRAEPADIEDAAAAAAMVTAATAVAAPTLQKQPATVQEETSALPAMASGPHLSEAVQEATSAAGAGMVPVPLSQQYAIALPGPGINASFLSGGQPIPAAALPASEVPAEDGHESPLQQEASTASVVAVAAAASTVVVAADWCTDATGLCSASAVTASTSTGIAVVAGETNDQDAANEPPASSQGVVPGQSPAGLVSVTAASTSAEATSASAAGQAEDAAAVLSMQAVLKDRQQSAAIEQAGSTGDAELSQLSSFTSQQYAADNRADGTGDAASSQLSSVDSQQLGADLSDGSSEQQGGAATDDGPWSNPAQGEQAGGGRDGNEDGSSAMMPGSRMSLGPSVKQSVRRLEQIHTAMRNKA